MTTTPTIATATTRSLKDDGETVTQKDIAKVDAEIIQELKLLFEDDEVIEEDSKSVYRRGE